MKKLLPLATPLKRNLAALSYLLGAPARWKMLFELTRHDLVSVSHLAGKCRLTLANTSMHIRILKDAGIIEQGMGRLYRLTPAYRPAPGQDYLDLGICRLMLPPPE